MCYRKGKLGEEVKGVWEDERRMDYNFPIPYYRLFYIFLTVIHVLSMNICSDIIIVK